MPAIISIYTIGGINMKCFKLIYEYPEEDLDGTPLTFKTSMLLSGTEEA